MYEFVRGRLARKTPSAAVVEAGGVGFRIEIPLTTYERLPAVGEEALLLTVFVVREDQQRLFGFATEDERSFFGALQAVSGVGPAVALSIVSSVTLADFRRAVLAGDAVRLRKVRGIGRKLSERLVLEMKDVVSSLGSADAGADPADVAVRDALLALEALGFPRADGAEALRAVRDEAGAAADAGDLVRRALRRL